MKKGAYGCWIDPANKPHSVRPFGHSDWIKEHLGPIGGKANDVDHRPQAYARGYVRVRFGPGTMLQLAGAREALHKSSTCWLSWTSEAGRVSIDVIEPEAGAMVANPKPPEFALPDELSRVLALIEPGR